MENRYQITGCQIIYADGSRDNVKFAQPIMACDLDAERKKIKEAHGAQHVNLYYTELI